ncbi:MAG TPA: ABC transporter substrate-binding protein [Acidimicrobiales bacterium]|nr:ABC transporter substrate-binding protein [Acidimicrobiales bacterium]
MPSQYDRRQFLGNMGRTATGLTIVAGAGGLISACGTTNVKKPGYKAPRGGVGNPATLKFGGSINFAVEADEVSMDPTEAHFDSTGVMYARTVYDPLMIVQQPTPAEPAKIVPYLAKSVTPNSDYTVWTITLRPGIFFHDGTPCSGQELKFCLDQMVASPLVNFTTTYIEKISYSASDPLSVQIKMNKPWVPFPAWLTGYIGGQMAYVFSPTQFMKHDSSGSSLLASHPVGTGPFMHSDWVIGDHYTFVRNPNYWRFNFQKKRMPYLDSVTYKPVPVVSTRWEGLKDGSYDIIHTDDPTTILDIRADKSLQDVEDDILNVEHDMNFLMINTLKPVVNDVNMRRALAYAFDQKSYLQDPDLGVDLGSSGPFSPASPYYAPTGYPTFDLAKATQLVNAYKAQHGGSINIQSNVVATPNSQSDAAIVKNFFDAAGIGTTPITLQQSQLINDAVFGEFTMVGWRQFANVDPDLNYPFWAAGGGGGLSVNFSRLSDPNVQKAIDTGRQTADPEARIEAYQTVAKEFGSQCPYIWSGQDVWAIGARSRVQNFNGPTSPDGVLALGMLSGIVWVTETWVTD